MCFKKLLLVVMVVLTAVFPFCVINVSAENNLRDGIITGDMVRLRDKPSSVDSTTIAYLATATVVCIKGIVSGNEAVPGGGTIWYSVIAEGIEGYVYGKYVALLNDQRWNFIIKNDTLFIYGLGDTDNYKTQGSVPWYDYAGQIKKIIIDEGITKIGTYAFYCFDNLESVICKNADAEFGRYALNTANENLTVYAQNGTLAGYCMDNGIRFMDVTEKPELENFTANSITLKAVGGYEYSKDKNSWQTNAIFGNLSPGTEYKIYARLIKTRDDFPDKTSAPLIVTTDKSSISAPQKPICIRNTDTEIELEPNALYEYSIDGENWQKSNVFTGLIHGNAYLLYQRVAETETSYASPASQPLVMPLVKKTVSAPSAPDYQSHTENSITLAPNNLYEYSMDGENWQNSSEFTGLSKNTIYRFYQRVAETETEYASAQSKPLIVAIPDKPVILEAGYDSILVKLVEGFEYCLDDFVWQESNAFDKLIDNTEYYVYQRLKDIEGEKIYQIASEYTAATTDNSIAHTHSIKNWICQKTATCTETGMEIGVCADCGQEVTRKTDALGHTGGSATCHSRAICTHCGNEYGELNPNNHGGETEIRGAKAATCTEAGYTGDTYCLGCGVKIATGESTAIIDHNQTDWIIDKPATLTETGSKHKECSVCGEILETAEIPVIEQTAPRIEIESKKANAGKTVNVKINLVNNPGITSAKLKLNYSADLTLKKVTFGDIGGQALVSENLDSPVTLNWFDGINNMETENTVFATLTFEVAQNAQIGMSDITVTYNPEDIHNTSDTNIAFAAINGKVEVVDTVPGDINGDGSLNNKDLTRLFQYLSDWEVEVDEAALDVNGDGAVNNKDLTRLFQYLSDWDVEIF